MMRNVLSASQVALRLGVQLSTVYAYVSRGVLTRTLAPDGRTSRFDSAEVEQLARRGRPRQGSARRGTIEVSLATSVTRIEEERLSYRGHDAVALAASGLSFEAAAGLLWTDALEEHGAPWTAPEGAKRVVQAIAKAMPRASGPLDRFAATAAALAPLFPLRSDLRAESVCAHARVLAAAFVEALPIPPNTRARARSQDAKTLAQRLWPRLSTLAPTPSRLRLLDAALVLLADHELATSTMAARVAASTRADPFAVVLAGIGALHGPLHGRAALAMHRLFLEAAASSPEAAVAQALAGGLQRAFGHPVYRKQDPRAVHLFARLAEVADRRARALVEGVVAAGSQVAQASANVDCALAAIAFALEMPLGATEAIFAIARTAGWVAHALEEYGEEPLRFRARAIFLG